MKTHLSRITVMALMMIVAGCSPAQSSPTVPATPDPAGIISAYFMAVNAKDLDTAMTFVADDAVFSVGGPAGGIKTGKDEIRAWLQSEVDRGITFEMSNVQVTGDKVTMAFKVFLNNRQVGEGVREAIVEDGKITSFQEE